MAILQHTLGDHHVDPTDPLLKAACSEPNRRLMKVISYGGGVQSTALLVLAARREIDFRTFLFANVGDDSEHPATLAYVREIAIPYAMRAGLDIHQPNRRRRDGASETPIHPRDRADTRPTPNPVRMANRAPGR